MDVLDRWLVTLGGAPTNLWGRLRTRHRNHAWYRCERFVNCESASAAGAETCAEAKDLTAKGPAIFHCPHQCLSYPCRDPAAIGPLCISNVEDQAIDEIAIVQRDRRPTRPPISWRWCSSMPTD